MAARTKARVGGCSFGAVPRVWAGRFGRRWWLAVSSAAARVGGRGDGACRSADLHHGAHHAINDAPRHPLARSNSVMRENRALADAKFNKLRCSTQPRPSRAPAAPCCALLHPSSILAARPDRSATTTPAPEPEPQPEPQPESQPEPLLSRIVRASPLAPHASRLAPRPSPHAPRPSDLAVCLGRAQPREGEGAGAGPRQPRALQREVGQHAALSGPPAQGAEPGPARPCMPAAAAGAVPAGGLVVSYRGSGMCRARHHLIHGEVLASGGVFWRVGRETISHVAHSRPVDSSRGYCAVYGIFLTISRALTFD